MSARRIVRATLGAPLRVEPEGHGDLWTTTSAVDDHLYSVADDCRGSGEACRSNPAVHRVAGTEPTALRRETVNCMGEYGELAAPCWVFAAGDFATQAHYALHAVPVSLEVEE